MRFGRTQQVPFYYMIAVLAIMIVFQSCKKEEQSTTSSSPIQYYTQFGSFHVERSRHFDNGQTVLVGRSNEAAMILVLDKEGQVLWQHKLNGSSIYNDVVLLDNGNYFAFGNTDSKELGAENYGNNSLLVTYTPSGSPTIKVLKSTSEVLLNAGYKMADGNITVVGYTRDGSRKTLVVSFDQDLNINWANEYSIGPWHSMGLDVIEMPDGETAVIGYRSLSSFTSEVSHFVTYFLRLNSQTGAWRGINEYTDHAREARLNGLLPSRIRVARTDDGLCWATTEEEDGLKVGIHWMRVSWKGQVVSDNRFYGLRNAMVESLIALEDGSYLICGGTTTADATATAGGFHTMKYLLKQVDANGDEIWGKDFGDENQIQLVVGGGQNGVNFRIIGLQESTTNGLRHPCLFDLNRDGEIVMDKP